MAFDALDELLDESLKLPIGGRTYTVPAPDAETGLRVQRLVSAAGRAAGGGDVDADLVADAEERDLYADVLGSAYAELVADGVSWPALKHCAITAMVWIAQDRDAAERYWNAGGDPERLAPNRQARRSAGASTTKRAASTSGTSTRTAPRHRGGQRRR
ncbi:hypothetical protein DEH18_33440 [Streptomyces sp. NHF165]|uniref:DUF7426 family protein n=1 Tax=Streptomyces TaxID=1883 RepID=UPI00132F0D4F|nr:hypothetical protein [Streptomyces sp. NHF165]QHF97933.1 hypothetical protein DEH18_33440 [Streptomyces sp. NHF165]